MLHFSRNHSELDELVDKLTEDGSVGFTLFPVPKHQTHQTDGLTSEGLEVPEREELVVGPVVAHIELTGAVQESLNHPLNHLTVQQFFLESF